jgi:hypothetical protein
VRSAPLRAILAKSPSSTSRGIPSSVSENSGACSQIQVSGNTRSAVRNMQFRRRPKVSGALERAWVTSSLRQRRYLAIKACIRPSVALQTFVDRSSWFSCSASRLSGWHCHRSVKRRTHDASNDPSGILNRGTAFYPWRSTSFGVLGLGVGLWVFLLSTGLPIRLLLSTPLCLCRVGLAWLGLASWVASVVAANMR